jgi:F-type H+-transporting ATPase subunit a
MTAVAVVATLVFVIGMRQRALVPGRLQSMAELGYEFIADMVHDNIGEAGKKYFPFVLTLFVFVLGCNMLGMIPYSFTPTSHIIVTFAIAAVVFIGVTIIGFVRHGFHYLSLFVPQGVPMLLVPLMVAIEVISYLTRPISLSVRLFANMLAGHTMLTIFGGFVIGLGIVGGWAPLVFIVALIGLEFLIAFLQAFVFAILTCLYLNDALNLEH